MFYDPRVSLRPAPLTHNPLNALVAPRPIAWVGTLSAAGVPNLAPFSYFNAFSADPPVVGFAPNGREDGGAKDSLINVRARGEFSVSIVTADLAGVMNETSRAVPHGVSEFELAGVQAAPSKLIAPPRVAASPAALECVVADIVTLPCRPGGRASHLVIGEVVGVHIDDAVIRDGRVDALAMRQLSRLGYFDYAAVDGVFEMLRPG